jgi:hypothetical protein
MDIRGLHHQKAKQIKVSNVAPINSDGQNGDMQLITSSNINNNELLYIKINNEWKIIGLEDRPNFTSGRTVPNIDKIQHKGDEAISISDTSLTIDRSLIFKSSNVYTLAANGSIPITNSFINIDAGGGLRTGIRFEGIGTVGQIIIVNNTGGETLTFHATPGTCLVRGMTTSLDTMESLGVYMFISDGSLWNLIGGGSLPNEGLTAS